MRNKAVLMVVGLLALLPVLALAGPQIGDAAPDFSVPDTTGTMYSLSGFHGKVVQLFFWSNT
jgi:hypothetical protein